MINSRLFDWYGIDTKKNIGLDLFCPRPYDTVLIDKMGSCYLCECTSWLPQSAGNLHIQKLEQIINSPTAKELQKSIADGSYRYCNNKQCSYLLNDPHLVNAKSITKVWEDEVPQIKIKNIRLAIDDSCNLSCPSCRKHQIFERDKFQLRKKYKLADRIIEYVQSQSHQINIHVGSDGDPFASLVYRYFIKKIKNLSNVKFTIQTNGLLIKKMYDRHTELFKNLTALNISIDGATKETYEKLRKGGSYKKIIENLEFVKKIKNSLSFKYNLHMVVQEENWREMFLMLEVAKKMSVDKIFFNKIENWNTNLDFSKQNFVNNNDFKKLCKVINADRITETWTLF